LAHRPAGTIAEKLRNSVPFRARSLAFLRRVYERPPCWDILAIQGTVSVIRDSEGPSWRKKNEVLMARRFAPPARSEQSRIQVGRPHRVWPHPLQSCSRPVNGIQLKPKRWSPYLRSNFARNSTSRPFLFPCCAAITISADFAYRECILWSSETRSVSVLEGGGYYDKRLAAFSRQETQAFEISMGCWDCESYISLVRREP